MHGFVSYVDVEVCGYIGSVSQKVAWVQWGSWSCKILTWAKKFWLGFKTLFQSKFSFWPEIWRGSKDENVYMRTLITVMVFIIVWGSGVSNFIGRNQKVGTYQVVVF